MGFSVSAFNKAGARLLQKQTGIKIEKQIINLDGTPFSMGFKRVQGVQPPKNAVTASFVQGERKFGQETFDIVTFFDDKGKIIQRHRFIKPANGNDRKLQSVSDYKNQALRTSSYMYTVTVEREAFTRHTQSFKPDGKIKKDSFSTVSIDYNKGLYSRTDSSLSPNSTGIYESAGRNPELPGTLHLADMFETTIQQWGKQTPRKVYERSIIYNPSTGCFTPIHSKGKNLTQNEINLLNQDKYLPLRFHPKLNSVEYLKQDAFAEQHIPLNTKIEYEKVSKDTITKTAGYVKDNDPTTIYVVYKEGRQKHPYFLHDSANILNHESRHIWQHRLVDDIEKGKIKAPQLKKIAQALKDSFSKERIRPEKDLEGYMNQFHEADAYKIGDAVGNSVYQGYNNLRQIFTNTMPT